MAPSSNAELEGSIAIIGLASRLPGASSESEFWELLSSARSARSKVPADRFNVDAFYHPDPERADSSNVRHGHFLTEDIARFDAPFFSIQPNEAVSMDPQQRLVLETSYHALENAGLSIDTVAGSRTAVYIGTSSRDYESILTQDSDEPSKYIGTGIGTSLIANRVSWFLDLKGPSLAIDTGCSGSLVALHHACQAIRSGESDTALVGGVSLIISPDVSLVHLSNMGFFSPDGYCFSFDERANGYSKGEGVAVVVLKRLSDALRDGNTIRAIVRASSCNQDGHTPGLTVPSIDAQVENIRDAYQKAGLGFADTAFFEAHGTGTQVGDTVEAEAIHRVFQRTCQDPLYVGALKSNIGHLEAASGVAGLTKSILCLEHGIIPPNLNFRNPNPKIDPEGWGLKFPTQTTPWPKKGLRRISLNSFGYGGTNAHVILDDAASFLAQRGIQGTHNTSFSRDGSGNDINGHAHETEDPAVGGNGYAIDRTNNSADSHHVSSSPEARLVVFSASDETSLKNMLASHQRYFQELNEDTFGYVTWGTKCLLEKLNYYPGSISHFPAYLDSLSHTLATQRSKLPWKTFTSIRSSTDLKQDLDARVQPAIRSSRPTQLLMVFSGQGAQYAQMGQELLIYTVYNDSLNKAGEVLRTLGCNWSLTSELAKPKSESLIDSPLYSQPACTALQLALTDLLCSWGILPKAVVGHSSGEIAAAYAAGALTFEQALQVAYFRGVVAAKLEANPSVEGTMSSIGMSREEVTPLIDSINNGITRIQIGCVNSNKNVTVTGQATAIGEINAKMESQGIFARKLAVTVPYHSTYMTTVSDQYYISLHGLSKTSKLNGSQAQSDNQGTVRMFSSVTGREIKPSELQLPDYWVSNMVSQVRFLEAMSEMLHSAIDSSPGQTHQLLEVGPHSVLQRPIQDIITYLKEEKNVQYESLLTKGKNAEDTTLTAIGHLWCKNVPIDVSGVRRDCSKPHTSQHLLDLPAYPFNHSTRYWHEGRISRNYRFKKYPRHDFLGNRVADWNRLEPRWRNIVRLSEHPWLRDYIICGKILYPPGALLVMAIEAVRQLHDYSNKDLGSFQFEGVAFEKELVIPDTEQLETQINLRRVDDGHEFSIYAFEDDQATLVCRGVIRTLVAHTFPALERKMAQDHFNDRRKRCTDRVDASQYFENLADMGYSFGPNFQKFPCIEYNDTRFAVGQLKHHASKDKIGSGISDEYIIHPADLEAMLQMSFAASSCGGTVKTPTQITKTLPNMWLKNKKMYQGYEDIECLAEENSRGMFDADSTISAVGSSGEIVLQVDQLRHTTSINFDAVEFESPVKRLAYQVAWKEDPDLLSGAQTKELMRASVPPEEAPLDEDEDFQELLAYHYVQNATTSLSSAEVEKMPPHLQKYMAWARHIFKKDHYERLLQSFPRFADEHTREEYEDQQRSRSSAIELHVETGRQLLSILRGESDALNLLFKSGLAGRYYANEMFAANYKMLASYLDLCAHKNPSLKILEVGAGTGGATKPIIAALSNDNKQTGITRFEEYMYTDISPAFFEKAKDLFKGHVDRMSFQVLDIEKDVLSQKFPSDHYDIVICSGVLHISAAMQPILNNIRKLLRPGGKLVQFEPSNPETCRAGFTFGLLKDWWVSKEEHRQFSPLIGEDKWDEDLKAAGFSGIDVAIPSNEVKERQTHSIFISTRVESDNGERHDNGVANDMVIIADPRSTTQKQVAQHLEQSWMDRYASCVTSSFSELSNRKLPANATYIFLVELEESFLRNIQPEEWATLKAIMDQAARVIWATRGGGQRPSNPDMSLVTGFGRSMMTEKLGLDFLELALDGDSSILHAAECVERVVTQRLAGNHEPLEPEYSEEDTRLCIGRLLAADSINERLHGNIVQRKPLEAQLWGEDNKGRCLKVAIQQPGHFESIYFVEDPEVNRVPVAGEVKIRVEAATITPVDVEIAMGHRSGRGFGSECAGTIVQVSPESQFRVGDRVCAGLPQGGLATHVLVSGSAVAKIPENMSFTQAVTLPSAVMIAHYSIMDAARLTEGESLLVSTKSSVTNSAAIALALKTGADVYVTAADETEGAELVKVFSLPSKRVFVKSPSISASIEDGFDAIVSDECAQYASQYCESLAPFGRLINIGPSTSPPLAKDCSYFEVEYADLMSTRKKKKSLQDMMQPLMWLLEMGNPATKFLRFNASQIADAFAYVLNSPGHGKAVFELGLTDLVQIAPPRAPLSKFDSNATYVIGGGSGGIGRAIALWLASNGAKHILILARSGTASPAMQSLLTDLVARGIDIQAPSCDLSNAESVQNVLREVRDTMPPIKGVIQSTMVLREGILENLTSEDWHAALAPKVQGTWNLHTYLPRGLEFFVCLSSVAGITGCRSQASYNAACTYQDSLMRYRHTIGERGVSFDLGTVIGVGSAAATDKTAMLRREGYLGIRKTELLAMLDYCCSSETQISSPQQTQLVTGLSWMLQYKPSDQSKVYWTRNAICAVLRQMNSSVATAASDNKEVSAGELLAAAESEAEATNVALEALIGKLSRLFSIPTSDVDANMPILAIGIDSLVALEVRYWLMKELKADVPVSEINKDQALVDLARCAAGKSQYRTEGEV